MPKGKGKGSAFERRIAKDIVKAFKKKFPWVSQRHCWRSVLSGGHEMSAGDLEMSPEMERLFPYAVECKFHKKVNWWHFLLPPGSKSFKKTWPEWQWVAQACEGARKRKGLKPLLVVHGNRGPILVVRTPRADETGWWFELWKDFLKRVVSEAQG
jgi:hypothetical protein